MNYNYYQSGGPWQSAWGTNAYQFQAPPMPTYVPQPNWGGYDYFNAHGGGEDSTLFDYVWSKVRGAVTGHYVSRGEAEHWHRRVYGGFVQLQELMPREVGAAAGWETVRIWQSHGSTYRSPLGGEMAREREAIMGLAIAEASRLWQYVGRPLDKYGRREACEVAAATASKVFVQMFGYDSPYDAYNGGTLPSRYSDYGDDDMGYRRGRRGSFSGVGSAYGGGLGYGGSNYGGSSYGAITPYSGAMSTLGSSYGGYGGYGGGGYGGGYGGYGGGYGGSAYGGSAYGGSAYGGVSPYGAGYGGAGYVGSYPGGGMQYPAQTPAVILQSDSGGRHRSRSRHRSHSHSRRHRSRSRASSYVPTYSNY